jgi:hypothetical protein
MNTQPGCLTLKITPEVGKPEHLSLTKQICTTFIFSIEEGVLAHCLQKSTTYLHE